MRDKPPHQRDAARNPASSHSREVFVGPRTICSRPPRNPSTTAFSLPYFQLRPTGQAPMTGGNMITSKTNSLMDPDPSAEEVDTKLEEKSQKPIREDPVPQWVNMKGGIISIQFFEACEDHVTEKRNFFCIDCVLPFCPNCLGHNKHKQIQIRKYVYRSVVNKKEMHKLVSCRGIQTYSTNNAKVLHLTPKPPHNKSQQNGSKQQVCLQCGGSLQEPFLYCCLACKILYEEGRTKELRRDSSILSGSNDTTNDEINGRDEILGVHPENEINGPYEILASHPENETNTRDEIFGSHSENETNGLDEVLDLHSANHNFRPETRRRKRKMPARSPFF